MRILRKTLLFLVGIQILSARDIDGALLLTRAGGRSLDGVAKESEFNLGFRIGIDLARFGACQTRLAFNRHRADQDDPISTPSGPRQGLSQSDAGLGLEAGWNQGIEWGGALEFRRDYLKLNAWPLSGLSEARINYDRIWFKAFAANIPAPGRFSPLVRAEIGFTPQHGRSIGAVSAGAKMKALAPDFHLTLCFGFRFTALGSS